jgi:K+-transporting ATPase KdpF subunit
MKEIYPMFEYWLAGLATVGLTIYLIYALVRPESF